MSNTPITKTDLLNANMITKEMDHAKILTTHYMSKGYDDYETNPQQLNQWITDSFKAIRERCTDIETAAYCDDLQQESQGNPAIGTGLLIALEALQETPDYKNSLPIYKPGTVNKFISNILAPCNKLKIARNNKAAAALNQEPKPAQTATDPNGTAATGSPAAAETPGTDNTANNQNSYSQLVPITAADCVVYPPIRYILDGIIEAETITLFSGKEKIGKSYVLQHMALSMAAGLPWLEIPTMEDEQGNVLWLDFDMNRTASMRRINQITNGIEESWNVRKPDLFKNFGLMDGQLFREAGYKDSFQFFNESDAVQGLREYMIANNVKVCFIDNLVQIEGEAEENSSNDIQMVFSRLKQLRDETHSAFIIIHHTTKDGFRGRGSSAIFGETDLNLQLEPCANDQLLLKTDGARNTANNNIGMMKQWQFRNDEDGFTPLTDDNGHFIYNFKLSRIDTEGLETLRESGSRAKTAKAAGSLEANINNIVALFTENGNKALTQTAIMKTCKMTGTNDSRKNAILEAFDRGILAKNTAGQYYLKTDTKIT